MAFQKAVRSTKRLRITLTGPPGSGKTYTALSIASGLGGKIALIDSEKGSASLYALQEGEPPNPGKFEFDTDILGSFDPRIYVEKIQEAERAGYPIIIIDGLSQAWNGKGGLLELVEKFTARSKSKNGFTEGWSQGTPIQNQLIDAIMSSSAHIISTMRTKVEYVIENDSRTGKMSPRKIGLAPVQRQDIEYEFDIVGEMDMQNNLIVAKTRWSRLRGEVIENPGAELGRMLNGWLNDVGGGGEEISRPAPTPPAAQVSRPSPSRAISPAPARPVPSGLATPEMVASLEALIKAVGLTGYQQREALAKRGVSSVERLTVEDATAMIHKLQAHMEGATAVEQVARRIEGAAPEEAARNAGARPQAVASDADAVEVPPGDPDQDDPVGEDAPVDPVDDYMIPDQPRREAPAMSR